MITNLILYILRAIVAVGLPLGAVIFLRQRQELKIRNVLHGVAVHLLFFCLLYAVVSTYLQVFTGVFENIESQVALSLADAVISTLCVALGYFIWFKAVIKAKNQNIGIAAGVGFSFSMAALSYLLPSVTNVVIIIKYLSNKNAVISTVFENNVAEIYSDTPFSLFLDLIQMILLFAVEIAFAVVFYCVLRLKSKKYWAGAIILLRIAVFALIQLSALINRSVIVLILTALAVVTAGIAYSLIKPFKAKE